jgi:hypothetical protein
MPNEQLARARRPARNRHRQIQKGERQMSNQHAGLSQTLAEQRITERQEQAA